MTAKSGGHRNWRRTVRRKISGPARRGSLRASAALRQWTSRDDNPFLERALRVEARRNRPLLSVATVALLLVTSLVAAWFGWKYLLGELPGLRQHYQYSMARLPLYIGGNIVAFTAILTAFICTSGAMFAARSRASSLLRQEMLRGTLDGLQLLPIREERWLWMMSTHPLLVSLLIGALGLPVYLLAVWTDQWNWLDLLGLLLVFVWIGHVAPLWQPAIWKQKTTKTPPKTNWAMLRAALQQNTASAGDVSQLTPAQRMEVGRRAQQIMSDPARFATTPNPQTASSEQKPATETRAQVGKNFGWVFGLLVPFLQILRFAGAWAPIGIAMAVGA
jgi:hypothetical protein